MEEKKVGISEIIGLLLSENSYYLYSEGRKEIIHRLKILFNSLNEGRKP